MTEDPGALRGYRDRELPWVERGLTGGGLPERGLARVVETDSGSDGEAKVQNVQSPGVDIFGLLGDAGLDRRSGPHAPDQNGDR